MQGTEYRGRVAQHDHEMVAPFCLPEYHPWAPDGEPYQIFKGAFSILRCAGWAGGRAKARPMLLQVVEGQHGPAAVLLLLAVCGTSPAVHPLAAHSPTLSPLPTPPSLFYRRCLRGRYVHRYNFDYMRRFMAAYERAAPWLLMSSFHEAHEGERLERHPAAYASVCCTSGGPLSAAHCCSAACA